MSTKPSVLYLDDEEMNLMVFKINFQEKYEVITCTKPEEALKELHQHAAKNPVVITDMKMPEMSGVEFVKKARDTYPEMYYCILTGFGMNEEIEAAIDAGDVQKYLSKPFDVDMIHEVMLTQSGKITE